ncbi:PrpF domain-containing protein [Microbacterium elymi]|uniref:Uncharacterized protein n=1 Tax=Microbacterium elymi TaxID=2909587 RepID=A0ABY5NHK7_9MICO|nr:PrpF domain-containing protein [Microbacterium elymi]UUT34672.1 hypothetical protein L2X98_29770 [Microbacterium elymi]
MPGTGSPVVTRYLNPAGGVLGSLLPVGAPVGPIEAPEGIVMASVVDAAHPYVFIRSADLDMTADGRSVAELNGDAGFLARIEQLRAAAAVAAGVAPDTATATASFPALPRIILVGPGNGGADVTVTAFSMGKAHRALPMTGALCLGAAAAIDGTLVAAAAGGTRQNLRIRHPLGVTEVVAQVQAGSQIIRSLGVVRTARRLMDGRVYPRDYS